MAESPVQVSALPFQTANIQDPSQSWTSTSRKRDRPNQCVTMLQALLRQREAELEERGRLLLKSKVTMSGGRGQGKARKAVEIGSIIVHNHPP